MIFDSFSFCCLPFLPVHTPADLYPMPISETYALMAVRSNALPLTASRLSPLPIACVRIPSWVCENVASAWG